MTASTRLLIDAYGRIVEEVRAVLTDIDTETLETRIEPEANTIAWLLWHLTRVQDDHVSDVAGHEQVWTSQDWYGRFGLPFPPEAHGYGHTTEEVGQVRGLSAEDLLGYHEAVHTHTVEVLSALDDGDHDRIVDTSWDPPVTVGVRLVSVIADDLEHVGQAAYLKGVLARRRRQAGAADGT